MIGKLWDAIIDPIIGFISDKTRSRIWAQARLHLTAAISARLRQWYFFTNPRSKNPALLTAWPRHSLTPQHGIIRIINIPPTPR
jgi:Na+/melibiose symporter-like transporter